MKPCAGECDIADAHSAIHSLADEGLRFTGFSMQREIIDMPSPDEWRRFESGPHATVILTFEKGGSHEGTPRR